MSLPLRVLVVLVALLAMACKPQAGSQVAGITMLLARNPPPQVREQPIEGRLVVADGCLWLDVDPDQRHAAVWPYDSRLTSDGAIPVVTVHDSTVPVGSEVTVVGGYWRAEDRIDDAIRGRIPAECRAATYAIVTDISLAP